MKRIILAIMAITILLTITTYPVLAPTSAPKGPHLWFYSEDPDTLNPPDILPDPEDYDPKWMGTDVDAWITQSIVIPSDDWETTFSIWLGCRKLESLGTKLVLSLNTAAAGAIETISIDVGADGSDEATLDPDNPAQWDKTGDPPADLTKHGVFGSAEYFGYAEILIGNLYSPPTTPYKIQIEITIELKNGVPADAKIHFDAYGEALDGTFMLNPNSHDATFVVPELGVLLLATASFSALGLYAIKRRKSSN